MPNRTRLTLPCEASNASEQAVRAIFLWSSSVAQCLRLEGRALGEQASQMVIPPQKEGALTGLSAERGTKKVPFVKTRSSRPSSSHCLAASTLEAVRDNAASGERQRAAAASNSGDKRQAAVASGDGVLVGIFFFILGISSLSFSHLVMTESPDACKTQIRIFSHSFL